MSATIGNPLQISEVVPDITQPFIRYFDLDLDTRNLTIYLSKIVTVSSIQLNSIVMWSEKVSGATTDVLELSSTNSFVLTTKNSPVVEIYLNLSAFINLKSFKDLAKSVIKTWITATTTFVYDTAPIPNPLFPIPTSAALMVREFR